MRGLRHRMGYLRHWGRWHHLATRPRSTLAFLLGSAEEGNFTYRIGNAGELDGFLADALRRPAAEMAGYRRELEGDAELRGWLSTWTWPAGRRHAELGRRIGWYMLVRALRPAAIVETGTHLGLGTAVLARALQRNEEGGGPRGHVWTFDVDPRAGTAIPVPLRPWVTQVHGDVRATLPARLPGLAPVGLMVHDSDHSAAHERFEFEAAAPHLAPDGVMLTDNGHETTVLADLSRELGRRYAFWHEEPVGHPDPGAGIGVSVPAG